LGPALIAEITHILWNDIQFPQPWRSLADFVSRELANRCKSGFAQLQNMYSAQEPVTTEDLRRIADICRDLLDPSRLCAATKEFVRWQFGKGSPSWQS
jgi:hypothetical protein